MSEFREFNFFNFLSVNCAFLRIFLASFHLLTQPALTEHSLKKKQFQFEIFPFFPFNHPFLFLCIILHCNLGILKWLECCLPAHQTSLIFRSQSYKRNLVFKNTKVVITSYRVHNSIYIIQVDHYG